MRLFKYFKYLLIDIADFLSLEKFRLYRMLLGGKWYKHTMNGELPNCYGSFWARYGKINRYTYIVKEEQY
jgi:hypothetical protein